MKWTGKLLLSVKLFLYTWLVLTPISVYWWWFWHHFTDVDWYPCTSDDWYLCTVITLEYVFWRWLWHLGTDYGSDIIWYLSTGDDSDISVLVMTITFGYFLSLWHLCTCICVEMMPLISLYWWRLSDMCRGVDSDISELVITLISVYWWKTWSFWSVNDSDTRLLVMKKKICTHIRADGQITTM